MTVEYMAPGIKCDLACTYCYQETMRKAGNFSTPTDWSLVKQAIEKYNTDFTVFGGEALLTPKEHLREVFEYGFKRSGKNGVQTNLLRLDDDHIELFKKYNVHVGVSIDGPWPLNSPRSTKEQTEKIMGNMERLAKAKVGQSTIITIHRENASRISELISFVSWLISLDVKSFNFHDLEVESLDVQLAIGLSNDESLSAFTELYHAFGRNVSLDINPFSDIRKLLTLPNASANCTWHACDPLTTPAVQGVMPDGSLVNCGRATKDGVNWVKNSDGYHKERYKALYNTPQEFGGCKDCLYFYACKGQCPGTAIDGDWRNKTSGCSFWYGLIDFIRTDLMQNNVMVLAPRQMQKMAAEFINSPDHQDSAHLDTPHIDWHEDHNDTGVRDAKTGF